MKPQQKQGKARLKSLAKDKNYSKSLTLMETVKAGDNGMIEKLKRNDYVLLLKHYYRIDDFDSKMKIAALRLRCMELYSTGVARATLPNDWYNTDRDMVLSSSDDDAEWRMQSNL